MCGWLSAAATRISRVNRSGPSSDAQLGPEHLDRHLAAVPEVVGQVDRGHPAAAELAEDGVAVGERVDHSRGGVAGRIVLSVATRVGAYT